METIRSDFDRLALLETRGWNHNSHYHPYLLRHVPPGCRDSLDIGCGSGEFTRLLAQRSQRVVGLDLSPQMIRLAQERSSEWPNIEYHEADALAWDLPAGGFDCIASIATLHHLPLDAVLAKAKAALRPNGVLLVLDLYRGEGWRDWLAYTPAFVASITLRLARTGRLREPPEVRAAWAEHGRHDTYLPLSHVRRTCDAAPARSRRQTPLAVALFDCVAISILLIKPLGSPPRSWPGCRALGFHSPLAGRPS